jgi:hypothetical protein
MNPKAAREILQGYRPSDADASHHRVHKALKALKKSPGLQAEFDSQRAFDRASAVALLSIPVPAEEDARLRGHAAGLAQAKRRPFFHDPAMVAVGVGFLLLIGVLIWHFAGQTGGFPDEVSRIAGEGMDSPEQFEAVQQKAGTLGDWVALKGLDSFYIPPEYKDTMIKSVRIYNVGNEPVAALKASGATFFIFQAQPFGINVSPEGTWRYGEFDQSGAAIKESGGTCFVAVVRGTRDDAIHAIEKKESEYGGQ